MKLIHIILIFFLFNHFNNIYADDPYCMRSFNGKIIITDKSGGAVYESPSVNSRLLFTLDYAIVIDACIWDTYQDAINQIPGNRIKVKVQDKKGFIFSTDAYLYYSASYSEEKIISMWGYGGINYNLTDNFCR